MFIDESTILYNQCLKKAEAGALDEAFYLAEVADLELYSELYQDIQGDLNFKRKLSDLKTEIKEVNEELKDDKITLNKVKFSWNRLLSYFAEALQIAGIGVAAGTALVVPNTIMRFKGKRLLAMSVVIVLSILTLALSRSASLLLTKNAQKKDIETAKKDIARLREKLEEKVEQDSANKDKWRSNLARLKGIEAMLDKGLRR